MGMRTPSSLARPAAPLGRRSCGGLARAAGNPTAQAAASGNPRQRTRVCRSDNKISLVGTPGRKGLFPPRASGEEGSVDDAVDGTDGPSIAADLARFLVLAYHATKGGSLFASQRFIACVVEAFAAGVSMDDIQRELSVLGMSMGPRSLPPMDQDVVISWALLVMLTMTEVGLEAPPGGGLGRSEDSTKAGLTGFVATTLAKVPEGFTLQRVLLTQQMVPEEQRSPSVILMQQNTRIVLLTLEVAKELRTSQLVSEFVEGGGGLVPTLEGPSITDRKDQRQLAIRILLAFIGLILGVPGSLLEFVEEAHNAYQQGWSAQEVLDGLEEEEFVQTGGIIPIKAGGNQQMAQQINGLLIARFLSLAYITWALAGVRFPGRLEKSTWAWPQVLGMEASATEANSWATFVRNGMRAEAAKYSADLAEMLKGGRPLLGSNKPSTVEPSEAGSGSASPRSEAYPDADNAPVSPGGFAYVEDPSLTQSSPTIALLKRQTAVVKAALTLVKGKWWDIGNYSSQEARGPS